MKDEKILEKFYAMGTDETNQDNIRLVLKNESLCINPVILSCFGDFWKNILTEIGLDNLSHVIFDINDDKYLEMEDIRTLFIPYFIL